jgi:hypothetical protein
MTLIIVKLLDNIGVIGEYNQALIPPSRQRIGNALDDSQQNPK